MAPSSVRDEDSRTDLIVLLRAVQSEYSQMSELSEVEAQDKRKLVNGLRVLQSVVEKVIPMKKEVLGEGFHRASEVYLGADCVVLVVLEDGSMISRPLNSFSASIVLAVIEECVPELNSLIAEQRRETNARIELLEKALKELKRSEPAVKQAGDVLEADEREGDLLRRAVTSG